VVDLSVTQIKRKYLECRYARNICISDKLKISVFEINAMPSFPSFLPLRTAMQLGQLLKTTRKGRKMTQADVAGRLGLSQNRISHLEQHPDELSVDQLLGWCAALGLELQLGERMPAEPTGEAEW
jgi:HTH-type transcriptional regulator / antitoxin HipB